MPAVAANVGSGDRDVDGMLEPYRWASPQLTFSFPTSGSQYQGYASGTEPYVLFQSLNDDQRTTVRDILLSYSSVANLDFSEVSGGAGDLRFGMTDDTESAHAYTPAGDSHAGDTWYNNTSGTFDEPLLGSYAYHAFIHEIGHAVGLKHPHETHKFGAVSDAHDMMEFSVMSYRSHAGGELGEYANEKFGYAQSLMMYDIGALQHMYGARFDAVPVDTVYRWDPATGELFVNGEGEGKPRSNRIFRTVWDGGGTDTYDFSGYAAGVTVDLRPGAWSKASDVQLVHLGDGHYARGNIANALLYQGDPRSLIENALGGSGADTLTGNDAANLLDGGAGADLLAGGSGDDCYVIDLARDEVVEAADGGTDLVRSFISCRLGANLENLTLAGSAAISGVGNGLANIIIGNAAANLLDGAAGADRMAGGNGNDVYRIDQSGDRASEREAGGVDKVQSLVSFRLGAEVEQLQLTGTDPVHGTGNALANQITGNAAANRLDGRAGADRMAGGAGDDLYMIDHGGDLAIERAGGGIDQVSSTVSCVLRAELENVELLGRRAIDATGNAAANLMIGNIGGNDIDGRAGADHVFGRAGNDRLLGGEGADSFYFDSALDRLANVDALPDFVREDDTIYLDRSIFSAIAADGRLAADAFHRGSAAADAQDRILFDETTGNLRYDPDGTGDAPAILFARLGEGVGITNLDFIGYH
ncbi:MAG TPA: M10 family metallopeptidase [Allosphingosinicella sp.]|nr:M10 family metallopeptidase [Allosphingosinicella sp.]